jgi:hypothetical protein
MTSGDHVNAAAYTVFVSGWNRRPGGTEMLKQKIRRSGVAGIS